MVKVSDIYVSASTSEEFEITSEQNEYWEIIKNNEAGVINKIDLDDFIANKDLYLKDVS